jgi:putative tricarboxylic transport membrane protein
MPPDHIMKVGPSFFPNILAGLLIIFSVASIIFALKGKSKGTVDPIRLSDKGVQRGLITLAATIVFCAVLEPLGFIPTAIIFLACMMLLMGNRKPLQLAIAPPLVALSVWLIFEKVLNLPMPAGILADIL